MSTLVVIGRKALIIRVAWSYDFIDVINFTSSGALRLQLLLYWSQYVLLLLIILPRT